MHSIPGDKKCLKIFAPFVFLLLFFKVPVTHLLISSCTNFVFLHSKIPGFLHCLGLIDMLSANQNAEIFLGILKMAKQVPECTVSGRKKRQKEDLNS